MGNHQVALISTIVYGKKTLEIIRHEDLHYYIYINGCKSDVKFYRSVFNCGGGIEQMKTLEGIYGLKDYIGYGMSKYNKNIIEGIFRKAFAEDYI